MFKGTAEESRCSTVLSFGSMKANQNHGNPLLNPLRTVGSWAKLKSSSGSLLCSSSKSAITWLGGNTCAGRVTFSFRFELSRVMFFRITSKRKCHTSLHHHFLVNIWIIFCFFFSEWMESHPQPLGWSDPILVLVLSSHAESAKAKVDPTCVCDD